MTAIIPVVIGRQHHDRDNASTRMCVVRIEVVSICCYYRCKVLMRFAAVVIACC